MDRKSLVVLAALFVFVTIYYQWLERQYTPPAKPAAISTPSGGTAAAPDAQAGGVPAPGLGPRLTDAGAPALIERSSAQEKILLDTRRGMIDFLQLQPFALRGDVPEPRILQERQTAEIPGSFWVEGAADGMGFPQDYRVVREDGREVVLEASGPALTVTKTLRLADPPFTHRVEVRITNRSSEALPGVRLKFWGFLDCSRVEPDEKRFNQFLAVKQNSIKRLNLNPKKVQTLTGPVQWIGVQQRYFAHLLSGPQTDAGAEALFFTGAEGASGAVAWVLPPFGLDPGQSRTFEFVSYIGPLEQQALIAAGHEFYRAVDFGWFSWFGHLLLSILRWLHRWTHNWGLAIILLSVLVKLAFQPFTGRALHAMHQMHKLQPQIHRLRERLKNDPAKMNQEMFALYKKHKVNPMGGCLPMVLQMPIFVALYHVLTRAIDIRHSQFVGWIEDLSRPDVLWSGHISGFALQVHLLPILMGAAMWAQQKVSLSLQGPESITDQQRMMARMMPILFTLMFYSVPSGLVLYWLINTLLSMVDYYGLWRKEKTPTVLDPA